VHRIGSDEGAVEVWAALDALVLKAMAIVLTRRLKPHLSQHCYHLTVPGQGTAAVRAVAANLAGNPFVFRTDVKCYNASIDHDRLFEMLRPLIPDGRVLDLVWQSITLSTLG
jgi:RNA-directed DNA polymerase